MTDYRVAAVWWVKRDFRLTDNATYTQALCDHPNDTVLPVFFTEPTVYETASETSTQHSSSVAQALIHLRNRLEERGSTVLLVNEDVIAGLDRLFFQLRFTHLYSHQETGSEVTFARDRAVARWCRRHHVTWVQSKQQGVFRPLANRDTRVVLWESFHQSDPLPEAPVRPLYPELRTLCADAWNAGQGQVQARANAHYGTTQIVTEKIARATLRGFLERRVSGYRGGISSPVTAFTTGSRLSVHLAWGTISSRTVWQSTRDALEYWKTERDAGNPRATYWISNLKAFSDRISWRDHFVQRLEDEPGMEFAALHPAYRELPCVSGAESDRRLEHWLTGTTGFPLVDASMRCLKQTGFLNFRMRAMVTSFACHALRLDWRTILHPLARLFRDYEPGIHISQVQMQAGVVGINTIRVYSPAKQLKEQDPQLRFTRLYLPELNTVPDTAILDSQSAVIPGYPMPCIDFAAETKIMKDVLWERKKQYADSPETRAVLQRHGSRNWLSLRQEGQ